MSPTNRTSHPVRTQAAGRPLTIGETQILAAGEVSAWEREAARRGHCIDAQTAPYGGGRLSIVRTFATAEDREQFLSRQYLGLPLVAEPA